MAKILIACEESQAVTKEFRALGHEAYSCDILPCSGGHPEWHIQGDLFEHLQSLPDGHYDFIGLHYPCTEVALCGNSTYGTNMIKNHLRIKAIEQTKLAWELCKQKGKRVYYENPKNVMGKFIGKKAQSIQPYQFGHPERKETWLWLHNLPLLQETNNVYEEMMLLPKKQRERIHYMSPSENRGCERSKTFPGIAAAMAIQWSKLL